MSLKKKKLAKAMSGQPEDYTPPTSEMLARMASEVLSRNQDTLVAHYIAKNPDVPADEITLLTWTDSEGMHFKVVREQKAEMTA